MRKWLVITVVLAGCGGSPERDVQAPPPRHDTGAIAFSWSGTIEGREDQAVEVGWACGVVTRRRRDLTVADPPHRLEVRARREQR